MEPLLDICADSPKIFAFNKKPSKNQSVSDTDCESCVYFQIQSQPFPLQLLLLLQQLLFLPQPQEVCHYSIFSLL